MLSASSCGSSVAPPGSHEPCAGFREPLRASGRDVERGAHLVGFERASQRVGAERVLFGTGFPVSEPMAAVAQLMYADISDHDRAMIGAGNLANLVEGIRR